MVARFLLFAFNSHRNCKNDLTTQRTGDFNFEAICDCFRMESLLLKRECATNSQTASTPQRSAVLYDPQTAGFGGLVASAGLMLTA